MSACRSLETTLDPTLAAVVGDQVDITVRASGDTANTRRALNFRYTVDDAGHSVTSDIYGLRIDCTETDKGPLGFNRPLQIFVNGASVFGVTAPAGATPSITSTKRLTTSDTMTIGAAGQTALTFSSASAVGISAADLTIGASAAQKVGFHGVAGTAQGAAVADATGAGDVVAQLNALLARIRAKGLIAT